EDDIPAYWMGNDPFLSLFLTALSAVFPEGERFFVDSVRRYRDLIENPVLKKAVSAFIGQEAHHSKEHKGLNDLMTRKGYPVDEIENKVGMGLTYLRKVLPPERQLAMTCALEHFTAILAELLLTSPELIERMDPRLR